MNAFLSLCLVLLSLIQSASAHNWMTSPARGNEAGENNGFNGFPAHPGPQKTARTHMQVGLGQKFPIEWASGHGFGSFTYFAVLRASDETKINDHSLELFDDYLNNAPSTTYLSDYPVYHVAHGDNTNQHLVPGNLAATYHWVPSDASTIGVRPSVFRDFGQNVHVKAKTANSVANNKRAKYNNPNYPWLISVHKFSMLYDFPEDADTTMMEIPAELEPGRYIIHYTWSGYYDVIDINVLSVPSTDLFGTPSGGSDYDRLDHCEFVSTYTGYEITSACTAVQVGQTFSEICAPLCALNSNTCDGIQLLPTTLHPKVTDTGIWSGREHLPKNSNGEEICPADLTSSDFVCFAVKQGEPLVGPTYRLSADPEAPHFYASCFTKSGGWSFSQQCDTCPPVQTDAKWIFGKSCVQCDKMRAYKQQGRLLPKWEFATDELQCRHCESEG